MTEAGFVLVHGGVHRAAHWGPLLPHLAHPAVAIDLPGRTATRAELQTIMLDDFVDSAVAAVKATGWKQVTLVGHSLAGLLLPEVAARLPGLVHHVVFVSCAVPPDGRAVIDAFPAPIRLFLHWRLRLGSVALPRAVAQRMFCNGMDGPQRRFVLDQLCAEPPCVVSTPVPARRWPEGTGLTYVLLTRDRALAPWMQQRQIARLGPCQVVKLDAPHDAFVSHPVELARIINRCDTGRAHG